MRGLKIMSIGREEYVYLHGFGSGPKSKKGVDLVNRLKSKDITLHIPNLNSPSFEKISVTESLKVIDNLYSSLSIGANLKFNLIGSSLGGYLASRWTQLNPEKVNKVILLCPAFDLPQRWIDSMGQDKINYWKAQGSLPFRDFNTGGLAQVHYQFFDDFSNHPAYPPIISCPVVIIHGTQDTSVPIELSRKYSKQHPDNVTLIEVEDDHELLKNVDLIESKIHQVFGTK